MRTLILGGAVSCLLLGSISLVRADEEKPKAAEPSAAAAQPADTSAKAPVKENSWRYRRHDGRWWYWLPSEKWVVWSDGKWTPYDPATYRQAHSTARRSYSYSAGRSYGRSGWGPWGPVLHNSYGDVQYPYSRRRTGMRNWALFRRRVACGHYPAGAESVSRPVALRRDSVPNYLTELALRV